MNKLAFLQMSKKKKSSELCVPTLFWWHGVPERIILVIQSAQNTYVRYSEARKSITGVDGQKPGPRVQPAPAIKTMPSYDPDAEVASLTLTIPSWISSIDRAQSNADLKLVSKTARMRLEEALRQLANKAFEMLEAVREDS